jgi:hypothetical protein
MVGDKYGCWNNPPAADGYWVQVRHYRDDGTYYLVDQYIEHKLSRDCKFDDFKATDARCAGCAR